MLTLFTRDGNAVTLTVSESSLILIALSTPDIVTFAASGLVIALTVDGNAVTEDATGFAACFMSDGADVTEVASVSSLLLSVVSDGIAVIRLVAVLRIPLFCELAAVTFAVREVPMRRNILPEIVETAALNTVSPRRIEPDAMATLASVLSRVCKIPFEAVAVTGAETTLPIPAFSVAGNVTDAERA